MINLLTETIDMLAAFSLTPEDVQWVGSRDGELGISWGEFAQIANVEYDNGYGSQQVASDLVVVGDGWWLERHEYDGSECWMYQTAPKPDEFYTSFKRVVTDWESGGSGYDGLEAMNKHDTR